MTKKKKVKLIVRFIYRTGARDGRGKFLATGNKDGSRQHSAIKQRMKFKGYSEAGKRHVPFPSFLCFLHSFSDTLFTNIYCHRNVWSLIQNNFLNSYSHRYYLSSVVTSSIFGESSTFISVVPYSPFYHLYQSLVYGSFHLAILILFWFFITAIISASSVSFN